MCAERFLAKPSHSPSCEFSTQPVFPTLNLYRAPEAMLTILDQEGVENLPSLIQNGQLSTPNLALFAVYAFAVAERGEKWPELDRFGGRKYVQEKVLELQSFKADGNEVGLCLWFLDNFCRRLNLNFDPKAIQFPKMNHWTAGDLMVLLHNNGYNPLNSKGPKGPRIFFKVLSLLTPSPKDSRVTCLAQTNRTNLANGLDEALRINRDGCSFGLTERIKILNATQIKGIPTQKRGLRLGPRDYTISTDPNNGAVIIHLTGKDLRQALEKLKEKIPSFLEKNYKGFIEMLISLYCLHLCFDGNKRTALLVTLSYFGGERIPCLFLNQSILGGEMKNVMMNMDPDTHLPTTSQISALVPKIPDEEWLTIEEYRIEILKNGFAQGFKYPPLIAEHAWLDLSA